MTGENGEEGMEGEWRVGEGVGEGVSKRVSRRQCRAESVEGRILPSRGH